MPRSSLKICGSSNGVAPAPDAAGEDVPWQGFQKMDLNFYICGILWEMLFFIYDSYQEHGDGTFFSAILDVRRK